MKKNHIIKQLHGLLQDAAHLNLKTEQNLEAHIFYFSIWGGGRDGNHIFTNNIWFLRSDRN